MTIILPGTLAFAIGDVSLWPEHREKARDCGARKGVTSLTMAYWEPRMTKELVLFFLFSFSEPSSLIKDISSPIIRWRLS